MPSAPFEIPAYEEQADLEATCAVLGITVEDIQRELRYRQLQKMAKLHKEMALAAKSGGVRRILKDTGDGGGEVAYMLHPISFHYWGRRLGYDCWQDEQFVREYLRDNPAARIKSVSDTTTVTVARTLAGPRIVGRGRWARAA